MVEITLPILLQIVQTAGILVGIIYYITIMRNSQRNQELARKAQEQSVETREAQLFMQIYQQLTSIESQKTWGELLNMEWDDIEDYRKKHDSTVNLDSWGKRGHIWWSYSTIGMMVKKGLIDPEMVYMTLGNMVIMQWDKWSEVIYDTRERSVRQGVKGGPYMFKGFEYLNDEMVKLLEKEDQGWTNTQNSRPDP